MGKLEQERYEKEKEANAALFTVLSAAGQASLFPELFEYCGLIAE